MATRIFSRFDTTPTNVVADVKAAILTSDAWSNPAGSRVVATTTRGADMVVDLADAAASATRMQLGVYRTSGLSDKVTRYIPWRGSGGATSDPIHVIVSAGKEHLFIAIDGPQAGEANAEATPARDAFFIGDIAPYFASDTVPAVLLAAATTTSPGNQNQAHVSRNAANNASWVTARLLTLTFPNVDTTPQTSNLVMPATADGNIYLWPFVVYESTAGIRGRVAEAFFVGYTGVTHYGPGLHARVSVNGNPYIVVMPIIEGSRNNPFAYAASGYHALIAVPHA